MTVQEDTALGIFERLFYCRVPKIDLISVEELEQFGSPATGFKDVDEDMRKELVDRYLNIATMAELFERGTRVRIREYADTATIYDLITAHLERWKQILYNSFNMRDAPIRDLLLLDKFANAIYTKAKFVFNHSHAEDVFIRGIDSVFAGGAFDNIDKLFADPLRPTVEDSTEVVDEHGFLPRSGMEDIFRTFDRS